MSAPVSSTSRAVALMAALVLPPVIGCAGDRVVNPTPSAPVELTLRVGERRVLADPRVEVGFERVAADSRCPTRVVCIWEGEARVVVLFRPVWGGKTLTGLSLLAPGAIDIGRYRLSALALDPYPEEPGRIPESAYQLRLRIESLR